jgi:YVTN family beta-propeller protein
MLLVVVGLLLLAVSGAIQPVTAQRSAEPTPLPLYALPDSRTRPVASNSLVLGRDNRTLVVANMLNNSISIASPLQGQLLAEIPVGKDPRSVVLTADGSLILVANRGDDTLSVVDLATQAVVRTIPLGGLWPYGVVTDNNETAYVSMQGSNEILCVDIVNGQVLWRAAVPAAPTGLSLWGDFLYITHFWSGELSLFYLPQQQVVYAASTGLNTGVTPSVEIDAIRGLAYVPQSRSNASAAHLTFDSTIFSVVNVMDLHGMAIQRRDRIALETADQPVNMPFAVAIDPFRQWLFVANAGSDNVSVIDLNTGLARTHIRAGANPRGLLLNRDNSYLFVHNALDGSISIIETRTLQVVDTLIVSDLVIPVNILLGAQLFHTATDPRLSADNRLSCANCHFDGLSDGRIWQDMPDGPRNAPLLFNLLETAPYRWTGDWDELADVEIKIRGLMAGTGLIEGQDVNSPQGDPHAGVSLDLETLVDYLLTLEGPKMNPLTIPAAAERGQAIFMEQGCDECHVGSVGTNLQRYDVDTGGEFDTPSLRWLWLSAPYFHDGRAATLADLFALPGQHQLITTLPAEDLQALVTYLMTLPE